MYTGIYKIADFSIQICSLYQQVQQLCADYRTEEAPELTIQILQSDIDAERVKSEREDRLEGLTVRQFPDSYLETLAVYRKISDYALRHDTLLFHGSVIAVDGQACLFTAKSGTGKSTHTRLWREMLGQRAVMVNDDKPLLRMTSEGVLACGTPWNGKHHLGANLSLPLKAVVILHRGVQNEIHQVSPAQALPMLLQQSYRPAEPAGMALAMTLLDQLAGQVEFYELHCNMEPEAARISYEAVFGKDAAR